MDKCWENDSFKLEQSAHWFGLKPYWDRRATLKVWFGLFFSLMERSYFRKDERTRLTVRRERLWRLFKSDENREILLFLPPPQNQPDLDVSVLEASLDPHTPAQNNHFRPG